MTNQIYGRLDLICQIGSLSVSMDMHKEDAGLIPEKVIAQSSYFKTMFQQRGHDRVPLLLCQDQVAHHDFFSPVAFRHCEPAAEAERSWQRVSRNLHM